MGVVERPHARADRHAQPVGDGRGHRPQQEDRRRRGNRTGAQTNHRHQHRGSGDRAGDHFGREVTQAAHAGQPGGPRRSGRRGLPFEQTAPRYGEANERQRIAWAES